MRRFTCAAAALAAAVATAAPASAQTPTEPVIDHIHLGVPDVAKGVEWYQKFFGGQPIREAPDRLMLGDTRLIFLKNDKAQPSSGSAIDHIGFSFADLDAKMKEFEAGGVKVTTPVREVAGLFKLGFIEDPWGTKIEVVEDSELLGFHHVHLRVPDPAAALACYSDMLGGDRAKLKGRIDGLRYGTVWLLAAGSGKDTVAPSLDRAIQNVAFLVPNVDDAVAVLKTKGVKTRIEPRSIGSVRYAFVEDPNGAQIELIHQQQ